MSLFRRKIAETDSSQSKNPKVVAFLELKSYISSFRQVCYMFLLFLKLCL